MIRVSRGTGSGPTRLAAFDRALQDAGLANYNLIRLSSVIPPNAVVREVSSLDSAAATHGDAAYCVYADAYASTPGEEAWAGVAWATITTTPAPGSLSSTAAQRRQLSDETSNRPCGRCRCPVANSYRLAGQMLSSAVCIDHPVCAVVVATYGTVALPLLITRRTGYDDDEAA